MKSILSISDIGTIRVCDIPLMAHISYAKQIFRGYDIQESNNGIYVRDVSYENLPKLDIFYRKNSEDRITEIRLSHYPLGQKECNVAYAFFKNNMNVRKYPISKFDV